MAAKGHRLSLGIGITYLLSKFHDVWWKTVLALIFLSFNLLRASIYPQCTAVKGKCHTNFRKGDLVMASHSIAFSMEYIRTQRLSSY